MKKPNKRAVSAAAPPAAIILMLIAAVVLAFGVIQPGMQETPDATPTPAVAATAAPGPAASLSQFIVLPDDDEQLLVDRISGARARVLMTMYMLTDPRIVEALVAAKKNGADVRALLEEHPFGAASAGDEAMQDLQAAGIETKFANPAFRLTHQKSFVVDDAAVIMTANMTKSAFSRNREFLVVHTDPADVAEVADAFKSDWERSEFTPASAALVWSPVNSRARIDGVIRAATRTLEVYAEVVQDKKQVALLAETAQRGVAVRLIISPKSSTPTGDSPDETGLDALQAAGVSIRQVKSPYIHAKAFVADGQLAFVGSENVTASSLDFNRELGILFTDAAAIQRLAATFEKDWQKGVER